KSETGETLPPRCYLTVDDADLFITSAFPEIFSKARQFGLAPMFITQALSYLDETVRNGIRKSRGTSIAFGSDDVPEARDIAQMLEGYEADDILRLGQGEAVLRTRYHGKSVSPVTVQTKAERDNLRSMSEVYKLRRAIK